jgi:hypothetical protein
MSKCYTIAVGSRVRVAATINGPRGLGARGQLGTVKAHDRAGLEVLLDGSIAPILVRTCDVVVLASDDRPARRRNLPRHEVRSIAARFCPRLLPVLDELVEDEVVALVEHQRSWLRRFGLLRAVN